MNTIAHKFLLLAQHPERNKVYISNEPKNSGLLGAILLDLAINECIALSGKRIMVSSTNTDLSEVHQDILMQMASTSKERSVRRWIAKFNNHQSKYRLQVYDDLEKAGLVTVKHKNLLFFDYFKTYLSNPQERQKLVDELKDIIINDKDIIGETALLLGLVNVCELHKALSDDEDEVDKIKKKLKEIIKSDAIGIGVNKVIQETNAAIIGSVASSAVAASSF